MLMRRNFNFLVASLIGFAGLVSTSLGAAPAASPTNGVVRPKLPSIRNLKVLPASITLKNGRDERKVLVLGETASGEKLDLTGEAKFKMETNIVEIGSDNFLRPIGKGQATVIVSAAGLQAKLPVTVEDASVPPVRFVRDIEPLMSKVGCNAGTCHGSAKGKNGFKLSLRGYDPEFDYQALISDLSGRRFNRVNVDESLMLSKPTAEIPHEGRQVLKPGSRDYQLVRQWIAEGTKNEDPAKGRANKIEVLPDQVELDLPGRSQNLIVLAHYPDGSTQDVTRDAVFTSNNGDVATINNGVVTGVRRGESAVLVRYEGNYATKEVSVMGNREGFVWVEPPQFNLIDKHVYTKLKKMKILPSDLCSDADFIRRVSFDLTGQPPSSGGVKEFINDKTPDRQKREKLVDDLLASPAYVDYWANKWADLLQCNSENLGKKGLWAFRQWIREAVAANKPYDQFVRELLLAKGSSFLNPGVNYLRVLREPGKMTEDISQTFLGVRFNCNKCHDHPFEKWTQNQYYEFGAYFSQVAFKKGSLGMGATGNPAGSGQNDAEEVVYRNLTGGELKHPRTDMNVNPRFPFGKGPDSEKDKDRRDQFVAWLTARDNPLFAKSFANRTWSYFFGRGIIDPVDDIRASNPPSNPALLDALTEEMIKSGFNAKQFMRNICLSRTYQLSIVKNKWNEDDSMNFSHAIPRRLSAEQLLDAMAMATGKRPQITGLPKDMRSVEIPDGLVTGNDFLSLFGRPKRQSACECERTSNVTLAHALNLINGSAIGDAVNTPGNNIAKWSETEKDPRKIVEEIYLAVLNRFPTEKEIEAVEFPEKGSRLEVAQDLAWALFNSPGFLFNR